MNIKSYKDATALLKKLASVCFATMTVQFCVAQSIPLDPAVRTGKLANGFTYYIRHNVEPQNHIEFYLVNKVGSILEDEHQRGLAHFLEHMNFNGTKHFPKNELVNYLQKAGVRFGAELNAYTTFDETVYQLPIPSQDPAMVKKAVEIMRDWAQEATLDSLEIEKERGIVLEEERLGKGAQDRMSRQYFPALLNYSRYANRLPIGLDQVLTTFKPATIRKFYHDWYRPDLQALIVVGDIDVNLLEKMIKAQFGTLKNPANERARTQYSIPLTGKNQFLTVTDKEESSTSLQLYIKHKAPSMKTEADYLTAMKHALFNQMLNARRYAELSQESNPAFVNAGMGIQPVLGNVDAFVFSVTTKDGQFEKAFQQAWTVVEKVKRFGFTQGEMDRARQNYARNMELALNEKNKVSSVGFVKEYQSHFLKNEAAPGIDWEYRFVKAHIDAITLADINAVTAEYLKTTNQDILVTAPEKAKSSLPNNAVVASWIKNVSNAPLVAWKDEQVTGALMAVKPVPGKVIAVDSIASLQVTTLTLSNGVKVILKPTAFKNDEIIFKAFAPGGTSLYSDSDYDAAANAAGIIGGFGLAGYNPVQLSKLLNGKTAKVGTYISGRSQGVSGGSTGSDLETALQLVYLQFTQPRMDTMLYNNIINSSRSMLPNRYADPNNAFNDTMAYVMGGYSYRSAPPDTMRLNRITLQKTYDIYKERFADASGFTFVFVGNFNTDSIRPLLEQYLGALPSKGLKEEARDLNIHIPSGHLVKTVYGGTEDKALVRLIFSGDYEYSSLDNLMLSALGQVLQIKLLQHLREQEGEVYSPSVQTSYNKYPKNRFAVIVAFGCSPKNVDHLVSMVKKEMDTLRMNGPSEEDIQKFKASYVKNVQMALKENSFWLNYLSGQYENNEDVLEVNRSTEQVNKLTPAALKAAAAKFLSGENSIQFALLPEKL